MYIHTYVQENVAGDNSNKPLKAGIHKGESLTGQT